MIATHSQNHRTPSLENRIRTFKSGPYLHERLERAARERPDRWLEFVQKIEGGYELPIRTTLANVALNRPETEPDDLRGFVREISSRIPRWVDKASVAIKALDSWGEGLSGATRATYELGREFLKTVKEPRDRFQIASFLLEQGDHRPSQNAELAVNLALKPTRSAERAAGLGTVVDWLAAHPPLPEMKKVLELAAKSPETRNNSLLIAARKVRSTEAHPDIALVRALLLTRGHKQPPASLMKAVGASEKWKESSRPVEAAILELEKVEARRNGSAKGQPDPSSQAPPSSPPPASQTIYEEDGFFILGLPKSQTA